jgi:hypothetical protein
MVIGLEWPKEETTDEPRPSRRASQPGGHLRFQAESLVRSNHRSYAAIDTRIRIEKAGGATLGAIRA